MKVDNRRDVDEVTVDSDGAIVVQAPLRASTQREHASHREAGMANSPVAVMSITVNAVVPLLVSVRFWPALVVFTA